MEKVICTSEERTKMEAFKREQKNEFEREEMLNQLEAERQGKTYEPKTFEDISDTDALAAVRAGWRSQLDKRFAKKAEKEGWSKH